MDILNVLALVIMTLMGLISALAMIITSLKERKERIKEEQRLIKEDQERRAANRKRTFNFFSTRCEKELVDSK